MYTCGGFILISGIKIDITLLTQMLMNLVATKIAQAWTSQTFNKYGSSVLNISTLPLSVALMIAELSTSSPLAQLINTTPSFILRIRPELMMPLFWFAI